MSDAFELIDSHCHLDYEGLAEDLPGVLARAEAAGVRRLITIGTRVARAQQPIAIAERFPNVWASVGTHPHNAAEEPDVTVADLVRLARHPRIVAIGEAGLDYHYDNSPRAAQEKGFRTHIAAARETGLPLVIHSRSADVDTARILEEEMAKGPFSAVLHCFTGSEALALTGIALGLHVSLSGVVTFKNAGHIATLAARLPLDRVLVETDAPFLAPIPYRGRPNEPAYVLETARKVAELRGIALLELAAATTANVERLFPRMLETRSAA